MKKSFLFFVVFVVCFTVSSVANVLYVAPTGSDSNPGTSTEPLATINRASELATPGTEVLVAPGVYRPPLGSCRYYGCAAVMTHANGTPTAHIRYISAVTLGAKIISSGFVLGATTDEFSGPINVWFNDGNYVEIVGFDLTGDGEVGIANEGEGVIEASNYIHNIKAPGACTSRWVHGTAAIDNNNYLGRNNSSAIWNILAYLGDYTNKCGGGTHGVYQAEHGGQVSYNLIYHVQGDAIVTWHDAGHNTFKNNTGHDAYNGLVIGASGYNCGPYKNALCVTDYNTTADNIFTNMWGEAIIELGNVGTHSTYSYNLGYNNKYSASVVTTLHPESVVGSRTANPAYLNPPLTDFRLLCGSAGSGRGALPTPVCP